jgi:tellurium resistance protein TerD
MSLSLSKGQTLSLSKKSNGAKRTRVTVGLGWELLTGVKELDLDATVFLASNNGTESVVSEDDGMIFFGQLESPKYGPDVKHHGDNRSGAGAEPIKEKIDIDFALLSQNRPNINEIMVFVTIYQQDANNQPLPESQMTQHFGLMTDAFLKIFDADTNEEICNYDLDATFPGNFAVQIGNFKKDAAGEWAFDAIGSGFNKNLMSIAKRLKVPFVVANY